MEQKCLHDRGIRLRCNVWPELGYLSLIWFEVSAVELHYGAETVRITRGMFRGDCCRWIFFSQRPRSELVSLRAGVVVKGAHFRVECLR